MATKIHLKFRNTDPPPPPYLGNIPKKNNFFWWLPILSLLQLPALFCKTRFFNSAAFYGLTHSAGKLEGDLYWATALGGAVEVFLIFRI